METLLNWILCLIGIAAYFLNRYQNRTDKTKELSISFWWKDNWPELTQVLLFTTGIMIILSLQTTQFDFSKLTWMPAWLKVAGKPIISFVLGLGGSAVIYLIFRKKAKYIEDKADEIVAKPLQ